MGEIGFERLKHMKDSAGFGDKPWSAWLNKLAENMPIESSASDRIKSATVSHLAPLWMENFIINLPKIVDSKTYPQTKENSSIGLLLKHTGKPAIVVGAGPSITEHKHLELLANSKFDGVLMVTDRMVVPALKKGVTPDKFKDYFVVSVDGSRTEIPKFFEDPILKGYALDITFLFASTGSPPAVDKVLQMGGKIWWFHGMLDSFDQLDSVTSFMNYMTGSTCVNGLGNTGGTCWTIANYLECNPILLIGVDYGYTADTPIEQTAYFHVFEQSGLTLEAMQALYTKAKNPLWNTEYSIDVVYQYYKDAFLHALELTKSTTISCTEGGSLYGGALIGMRFKDALKKLGAI